MLRSSEQREREGLGSEKVLKAVNSWVRAGQGGRSKVADNFSPKGLQFQPESANSSL